MEESSKFEDIEELLAAADELLEQIDSEFADYLEEGQRIALEKQAKRLKALKSEVEDKIGKEGSSDRVLHSEGVHEALDEIAKAMKSLADYIS